MLKRLLSLAGLVALLVGVIMTPAFAATDNASPILGTVRNADSDNVYACAALNAVADKPTPQVFTGCKHVLTSGSSRQPLATRPELAAAIGAFSGKSLCLRGDETTVNPQTAMDNSPMPSVTIANPQHGTVIFGPMSTIAFIVPTASPPAISEEIDYPLRE